LRQLDLSRPGPAFLFLLFALIVAAGAGRAVLRMHAERELLKTGDARWIWYSHDVRAPRWMRFYATREFLLDGLPARAIAKVFGDRRHVLYINGFGMGGTEQKPGDPLYLHDLTPHLKRGENRVVVVLETPTGSGGLLFALDISGVGQNAVVSDKSWRVDLSPNAIEKGGRYRAAVWGRPPMYPWGYPRMPRPNEVP
jgi:hypothetical protein